MSSVACAAVVASRHCCGVAGSAHTQKASTEQADAGHLGEVGVLQDVIIDLLCRINTKTGEVTRDALFEGQNLDHPRVNPNFYSRPTRYVYFNAAKLMDHPGNSGPPQVSWSRTAQFAPTVCRIRQCLADELCMLSRSRIAMAVHCMLMCREDARMHVSKGRTRDLCQQSGSSREAMSLQFGSATLLFTDALCELSGMSAGTAQMRGRAVIMLDYWKRAAAVHTPGCGDWGGAELVPWGPLLLRGAHLCAWAPRGHTGGRWDPPGHGL